jgi:hypothetical protein
MLEMSHSILGLESLALMLSLPYALLIWGYVSHCTKETVTYYLTEWYSSLQRCLS